MSFSKSHQPNAYLRLLKYISPYRYKFALTLLLAVVLSLIAPLRPLWIQKTIQAYIQKSVWVPYDAHTHLWDNEFVRAILLITVLQIGLILFETIARFFFSYVSSWIGQSVVRDLRLEVFHKIMGYKLSALDKIPIGNLTTRTISDIEAINNIFSDGFVPIVADLLSIVVVLSTMFYLNWKLSLISLLPFPLLLIATYFFKESVKKSFQKVRLVIGQLNAFVQEHLSNMNFIQVANLQDKTFEKFTQLNKQHRAANIKAIFAYSVFFPIVEITSAIAISFLIYSVLYTEVSAATLVFYFLCLNQIFRPLRFIADKFNIIQMGMVSSERIFAMLDSTEVLPYQAKQATIQHPIKGKIVFENVSFGYQDHLPIIQNLHLTIQVGEKVAFVGPTGNGKSTIISLINRLYQHQSGEIYIDDRPIQAYSLYELRMQIGVILQDVFLFSGTIRDNLTLYNPLISDDEMIQASKSLGLHDSIMNLPKGYDFHVMERGALLSAGQRQLIAFTRTLLYNPKILIMDEATSSIDVTSETLIQNALAMLIKGRTSILVAHRLSTIQKADKIFFIQKGQIVETGTHESLLEQKGLYHHLYHRVS